MEVPGLAKLGRKTYATRPTEKGKKPGEEKKNPNRNQASGPHGPIKINSCRSGRSSGHTQYPSAQSRGHPVPDLTKTGDLHITHSHST